MIITAAAYPQMRCALHKAIYFSLFFIFSCLKLNAQVSTYTFSHPNGSGYVAIAGTNAPGGTGSNELSQNIPIGFTFYFNGIAYTTCGISSNGFIWFGNTAPSNTETSPISDNTGCAGVIAAYATALAPGNGSAPSGLCSSFGGTGPFTGALTYLSKLPGADSTFTVQWLGYQSASGALDGANELSLQIVLTQCSNVIDIRYKANEYCWDSDDDFGQVGLGGASNSDYNNLSIGGCSFAGVWSNPTASSSGGNSTTCEMGINNNCWPAQSLDYRFTPTVGPLSCISCTPPVVNIGGTATICNGGSTNLTTNPAGTGPYSYAWTPATGGVTNVQNPTVSPTITTTYTVTVTDQGAANCTNSASVIVTVNTPPAAGITVTASATTICPGTNVTFTADTSNGGAAPTYQWKVNGSPVGTDNPTFSSNTLTNGNAVICVMTSSLTCVTNSPATSASINITVSAQPATISISANPSNTICAGTSVTFTADTTNGGAAPAFQWLWNGINVGTGTTTYTNTGLNANDTVRCIMTSNSTCLSGPAAVSSNTDTITISTGNPAAVSIASVPSNTICAGTSVTFTATPVNGGAGPTYQWILDGNNVGANTTTYTNAALNNNDSVRCIMTSNSTCLSGTAAVSSNTETITINAGPPAGVTITAAPSNTICSGASVTFTADTSNGGTAPTYQWQVNGVNATGTSTGIKYSSTTLAAGNVVTCIMTSNAACVSNSPDTSAGIPMTVNTSLPASVTITVAPSDTICPGANVIFTADTTNGGAAPTYQWKVNGVNATGASTAITYSSVTLTNNDKVTCVMTSNAACVSGSPATSNSITMTISTSTPLVSIEDFLVQNGNSIPIPAGGICAGDSVSFDAIPVSGGGSTPTYQWIINGVNMVADTSQSFVSTTFSNNDTVSCIMTSSLTCVSPTTAHSNIDTVKVNPAPAANAGINDTICPSQQAQLGAALVAGDTYLWSPTTALTDSTLSNPVASPVISTTYTLTETITATGCSSSHSVVVSMGTIDSASVSIAASPSNIICEGTPITVTATPVNAGTAPSYTWYNDGSVAGGNSTTFSPATPQNGDSISCVMTNPNNPCIVAPPSNTIYLTVNPVPPASILINAAPVNYVDSILQGTSVTLDATSGPFTYVWTPSLGLSSTNVFNPIAQPDTDIVYTVTISNGNCSNSDSVKIHMLFTTYILVPNAFSSNGDGINDTLFVKLGSGLRYLDFTVYNRYGQKVFHTNTVYKITTDPTNPLLGACFYSQSWDGTFNGKPLDAGVFVYYVTAEFANVQTQITKSGNITLLK